MLFRLCCENKSLMERRRIVSIGALPQWVIDGFLSEFEVCSVGDSSREAVLSALDNRVVAIVSRGPVMIDRELLEAAPQLQAIARTGVGFDTVDLEAASALKIPVLYTPGAMSRAVAEHAAALMLAAAKDLFTWHRRVLEGGWQARYQRHNLQLQGATLGIVGLGRIGTQVCELMRPFDMHILVNDPYLDPADFPSDELRFVGLEELLQLSDIVTLHVPLNQETRALINSENISKFKPGAILVNTARGAIVEHYDILYQALEKGFLGIVAMDTLIVEPPDLAHPIFHHPRVVFSAHVAARTEHAQRQILCTTGENLRAVLHGRPARKDLVANPQVLAE